jgi:rhodanese-related sulfurtransferase
MESRRRHRAPPGRRGRQVEPATLLAMSATIDPTELAVDPAQVAAWLDREPHPQLVDVREVYERDAGHIAGSLHIELTQLSTRVGELDSERPIVFYCRVGARSDMAAQALRASGFQAHSMRGGLHRWAQEGRSLTPADGYVADH